MGAGVHEQTMAFDFDKPGARANVGIGIKIGDFQNLILRRRKRRGGLVNLNFRV
jgi:hypothetical protein